MKEFEWFRTEPEEVTAVQWFPGVDFPGMQLETHAGNVVRAYITTPEGAQVYLTPGIWVTRKLVKGYYHYNTMAPTDFKKTFIKVEAITEEEVRERIAAVVDDLNTGVAMLDSLLYMHVNISDDDRDDIKAFIPTFKTLHDELGTKLDEMREEAFARARAQTAQRQEQSVN